MGTKDRLATIHGEIVDLSLKLIQDQAYFFNMMPLFHPQILLINPNMKKTAWADMQKAMRFLGI